MRRCQDCLSTGVACHLACQHKSLLVKHILLSLLCCPTLPPSPLPPGV
jgi:hypothetical protein